MEIGRQKAYKPYYLKTLQCVVTTVLHLNTWLGIAYNTTPVSYLDRELIFFLMLTCLLQPFPHASRC